MKTDFKKLPKNIGELTIELSVEEAQPYLDKTFKEMAEKIKIPGFRDGKVPIELAKERISAMDILKEAIETIVSETVFKTILEKKIEPLEQPRIDILKMAPNNPIAFKAVFSLMPRVKIGDYKKIKVEKIKVEINQEEVEKILKDLQKMRAKETLVKREVREGDKVILDIDISFNKVPLEGGQNKGAIIIVGDSYFVPGLDKNLLGLKENETKEFNLLYPDNFYDKKLAGKIVDFKVKINFVYQMDLPELNDSFVQTIGKFKDINELKNQIKNNLELEKKTENEQKLELEMLEKIVSLTVFEEIPDVLINQEIEKVLFELKEGVEGQGLKFSDYLIQLKKSEEELKNGFVPMAEKRIKTALVIKKIGQEEKIEATEEELKKEIDNILKLYPTDQKIKEKIAEKEYKTFLENLIINKKTINWIKEQLIFN